jgi:hypothetical protein
MSNDNSQAFPGGGFGPGMSLRDWFAGQALAGLFAGMPEHRWFETYSGFYSRENMAAVSYAFADAMLAERAKDDD